MLGELLDRLAGDGFRRSGSPCSASRRAPASRSSSPDGARERFGAVIGLSGGLIGDTVAPPPAGVRPFEGMPVLLGCSERDPHIPIGRVRETDEVMRALGAEVVTRVYPGGGHGINEDEVAIARRVLARMVAAASRAAGGARPHGPGRHQGPGMDGWPNRGRGPALLEERR